MAHQFQLALDAHDPVFIAWICKDVMVLIFFVLFTCLYCYGRYESDRKDHAVFQRLRFLVVLLAFCDFFWPFQYVFNLQLALRITVLSLASMFDLLECIIISTLSFRVFATYYLNKARTKRIPWYYTLIVVVYVLINIQTVVFEILAYSQTHRKLFSKFFKINSILWLVVTAIFSITLTIFLIRIISLFKMTTVNTLASLPVAETTPNTDFQRKLQLSQCTAKKAKYLYMKMIKLCTGIVLYYTNLAVIWIYFLVTWDINSTHSLFWILQHAIFGHGVMYITLWSYLKIMRRERFESAAYARLEHGVNGDGREKVDDEEEHAQYNMFGFFVNKTIGHHQSIQPGRGDVQVAYKSTVDLTQTRSYGDTELSSTYANTEYTH